MKAVVNRWRARWSAKSTARRLQRETEVRKAAIKDAQRITTLSDPERREMASRLAAAYLRQERAERPVQTAKRGLRGIIGFATFVVLGAVSVRITTSALLGSSTAVRDTAAYTPSTRAAASAALGVSVAGLLWSSSLLASWLGSIRRSWRVERPTVARPASIRTRLGESPLSFPLAIVALSLACAAVLLRKQPGFDFRAFWDTFESIAAGVVGVPLAAQGVLQVTRALEGVLERRANLMPFDRVVDIFARTVGAATELRPAWYRSDVSRYLGDRIELTLIWLDRSSEWSRRRSHALTGRRAAREDWLKVAAVLRAHKTALALVHTQEDYDRIVASLSTGLLAMLRNDWDALLANAPEELPPGHRLRQWSLTCLLPAALLATAAITLPYIPPLRDTGAAGEGLRLSLLAYALVKLIPRQQPVIDLLAGAFSRTGSSSK